MNKIKATFLLTALVVSGAVNAALDPITEVLELAVSELRTPAHEAARINVKPCAACAIKTVRVNTDTVYRVGGFAAAPVSLRDFRTAVAAAEQDELALVYLTYRVDSGVVTELVVQGSE